MAGGAEKKFCNTVIPKHWRQITGPAFAPNMTIGQANAAWSAYLRELNKLSPNPKVYSK